MYGDDNRCTVCGEHIADPHAVGCPSGDEPLFALTGGETSLWVVRHSTTGRIDYTGAELDCEAWVRDNPNVSWVAVEPKDAAPKSLQGYIDAGMMRNYPGEEKRRANFQLALI